MNTVSVCRSWTTPHSGGRLVGTADLPTHPHQWTHDIMPSDKSSDEVEAIKLVPHLHIKRLKRRGNHRCHNFGSRWKSQHQLSTQESFEAPQKLKPPLAWVRWGTIWEAAQLEEFFAFIVGAFGIAPLIYRRICKQQITAMFGMLTIKCKHNMHQELVQRGWHASCWIDWKHPPTLLLIQKRHKCLWESWERYYRYPCTMYVSARGVKY
jgi:hypothetical protein